MSLFGTDDPQKGNVMTIEDLNKIAQMFRDLDQPYRDFFEGMGANYDRGDVIVLPPSKEFEVPEKLKGRIKFNLTVPYGKILVLNGNNIMKPMSEWHTPTDVVG